MKHILTLILAASFLSPAFGQTNDHSDVHKLALKYNDLGVAITSLYYQLAKQPTNVQLKDSLATLYFQSGQLGQSLIISKEILQGKPEDRKMLELSAIAEQGLGRPKESLESYEKLFKLSKSLYHLYQIAILQFSLQRFPEASISLNQIIQAPESEKEKIVINISQTQRQEVPIRAAALNVMGVMSREQKNNDKAKEYFEAALKISPDFALPKGNIEDMNKPATDKKP